ncbi:unnamed protein product [Effrenium voratum]|nr:unnamed protein product [Effrenium voratum]
MSAVPLSGGQPSNVAPLPARMDDWTKLDYYRFCLFQRQVQEEFLRENTQLRSRLQLKGFPAMPQAAAESESWPPIQTCEETEVPVPLDDATDALSRSAADALSRSAATEKPPT